MPAITPDTIPELLTVAIIPRLLLQMPPGAASASGVVLPAHTAGTPVIVPASGSGFTVTVCVAIAVPHPLVTEYEIVVFPAATPSTDPVLLTVAIPVEPLIQLPPVAGSERMIVAPGHNAEAPTIVPATGNGFTVTMLVAIAEPQPLATA